MKARLLNQEPLIDGQPVPLAQVACLYQRDPHPGTSRYRLALRLATSTMPFQHLAQMPRGQWVTPDEQASWRLLSEVESLIGPSATASGLSRPDEATGYRYFLNSISSLCVSEGEVIVEGVCSPVITP